MINYFTSIDNCVSKIDAPEKGCWINVVDPEPEEIALLRDEFHIDKEYIKSSLDDEESARIEKEDDQTFIIFDVPYAEREDDDILYYTMPVGVVILHDYVVTISGKDNPVVQEFAQGVVKNVKTSYKTEFVLKMMFRMATRFLQYLKQIDKHSYNLEIRLRQSMKNKELVQLLGLEKSLVYFQTSLKSNNAMLEKTLRGKHLKLYEEDVELLEDVLIEMKQALEMTDIYTSVLSGTMDAFASVISNNLNISMKFLAALTIIISIPTIVFSFYGMNIGEQAGALPFGGTIWIPLALTVVLTGVVTWILYKKKMF